MTGRSAPWPCEIEALIVTLLLCGWFGSTGSGGGNERESCRSADNRQFPGPEDRMEPPRVYERRVPLVARGRQASDTGRRIHPMHLNACQSSHQADAPAPEGCFRQQDTNNHGQPFHNSAISAGCRT